MNSIPDPNQSHWLSTSEAAAALGCSERTVQRRANAGKIAARKVVAEDGEKWEINLGDDKDAARVTPKVASPVPPGDATGDDRGDTTFHTQIAEGDAKTAGGADSDDKSAAKVTPGDDKVTTPVPSGGATLEKSELEAARAELLDQLKGENQFLRAALEQRDRDAAELRAALRKALEIAPRQLVTGDAESRARTAATPTTQSAPDVAESGGATSPAIANDAARKEPRPLWKVILGIR